MSITIDDTSLDPQTLGLTTVGEVLSHVARGNRLVVQLLIDGSEPDLRQHDKVRARRVNDCTLFIETVHPQAIACDVLASIDEGMTEADGLRQQSAELFREGDASQAMQKLSACFATWNSAQDSLGKVARLLRADLTRVLTATGKPVEALLAGFADNLRQLKDALESRDHVLCCDVLTYDMESTTAQWHEATAALRKLAGC